MLCRQLAEMQNNILKLLLTEEAFFVFPKCQLILSNHGKVLCNAEIARRISKKITKLYSICMHENYILASRFKKL